VIRLSKRLAARDLQGPRDARRQPRLSRLCVLLPLLVVSFTASCRDVARAFGPGSARAQLHADQVFAAFEARFTRVERSAKYDTARLRLARTALTPSRLMDDTAVWAATPTPDSRELFGSGTMQDGRYHLVARPTMAPRPAQTGDARHVISLVRTSKNQYTWDTDVEFAIGAITARDVAVVIGALLASPEGRTEPQLRADYRAAAPRAVAALGALFSIDSLGTTTAANGVTAVSLSIGVHPESLSVRFPAFSRYLTKYSNPSRYRFTLTDRGGSVWLDAVGAKQRLDIRYRVLQGRLVPMLGPPRALPDSMQLRASFATKVKLFTVGMHDLVADLVITSNAHERAFTMVARKEPEWDLPFVTERFIRAPLRHPFEGEGFIFHMGVRDSANAQTLIQRRMHFAVQESAILRFLGGLGARALNEFDTRVELEQDLFLSELFAALRADMHALSALPNATAGETSNAAEP
jgi:hypothetical protein